jgi:hypothetical protein
MCETPGTVYQDVYLGNRTENFPYTFGRRYVAPVKPAFPTAAFDVPHGLGGAFFVEVEHGHFGALAGKKEGNGLADAAAAPGHNGGFTGKIKHIKER